MKVIQRGMDSSGRPVRATDTCWAAWDAACDALGFVPTIVQGGHMGNAGASASAGTHAGDAFDVRLWDRLSSHRDDMIRVFRSHGFAYWERYPSQGFDLHAHMVPGPWASPAPLALNQFNAYIDGRNGLASNGADYHPRPDPLVTAPPEDDMNPVQEAKLAEALERVKAIEAQLKPVAEAVAKQAAAFQKFRDNEWRRDVAEAARLKVIQDQTKP